MSYYLRQSPVRLQFVDVGADDVRGRGGGGGGGGVPARRLSWMRDPADSTVSERRRKKHSNLTKPISTVNVLA
jgi:hypothetical protein